jgi:hypothetical protein
MPNLVDVLISNFGSFSVHSVYHSSSVSLTYFGLTTGAVANWVYDVEGISFSDSGFPEIRTGRNGISWFRGGNSFGDSTEDEHMEPINRSLDAVLPMDTGMPFNFILAASPPFPYSSGLDNCDCSRECVEGSAMSPNLQANKVFIHT